MNQAVDPCQTRIRPCVAPSLTPFHNQDFPIEAFREFGGETGSGKADPLPAFQFFLFAHQNHNTLINPLLTFPSLEDTFSHHSCSSGEDRLPALSCLHLLCCYIEIFNYRLPCPSSSHRFPPPATVVNCL